MILFTPSSSEKECSILLRKFKHTTSDTSIKMDCFPRENFFADVTHDLLVYLRENLKTELRNFSLKKKLFDRSADIMHGGNLLPKD